MKICIQCEESKDESEFHKQKGRKDGLQVYCKKCKKSSLKKWREANRDKARKHSKDYYHNNTDMARECQKVWVSNNGEYFAERTRRYKLPDSRHMPGWADVKKIREIYKKARKSGMVVDHIVPIKSGIVCGLHCEDNLQLLSLVDNLKKKNYYWPDMPARYKGVL